MGQLVELRQRRVIFRPAPGERAVFFFDVSCPLSYLAAERVERRFGGAEWVAVDGATVRGAPPSRWQEDLLRRAALRAHALRLPLVWPDRFPTPAPRAQRAAAFACEIGAGPAFALAASRLAFCGGFDLEDPETLAEAAAASGVPLDGCLAAAGEAWRDNELRATAEALRRRGVGELPAISAVGRLHGGEAALAAAGAAAPLVRPLAPVG
jgi:2-hydroxychromene-2-carboxylate isomerase